MKKHGLFAVVVSLCLVLVGLGASAASSFAAAPTGGASVVPLQPPPKMLTGVQKVVKDPVLDHLTHPCGGMFAEPPFSGVSPLSIAYVPGMCADGYGDIGVWQADGHSYVVLSGFSLRMFHIFNVDDPYNPATLVSQTFPSGGTTSTSVFPFRQGTNRYISVTMRGSGSGCGYFVYNVNNPASPQFVARKTGTDWCTPHEHFVSTDAAGNADYAWLTMSGESGSGYKVVALDIHDLLNITETGRYERPDSEGSIFPNASGNIFAHDVTVIGSRVFLSNWAGGLIILDKDTLAHSINPTPLNPINSIRPSGFNVHHSWPTSDGNHVFIEDEFIYSPTVEKVRVYNISDVSAPYYEGGIIGPDTAANNRAHNLKMLPISPGHDLLFVGWYQAGTRGFDIDTTGTTPVITPSIKHQLRASTNGQFGNVWGVDYLPCLLPDRHGNRPARAATCVYSADMKYGLVTDALGYDATLDPYAPEGAVTDPVNGQTINACSYTITGTAHDYYSGVRRVEVSTDDGATWWLANGTDNWSFSWQIPADGTYSIKTRVWDMADNSAVSSAPVSVTVQGCTPATAVPTDTPTAIPTNTPVNTPTNTPVATPTVCAITFTDVHPGDYFYNAVRYLLCAGAVSGYADNTFRPYSNTTRGQLSKIVVLAEGWPIVTPSGNPTFNDVPAGSPFYSYVETAYTHGAVSGYTCGSGCLEFRPGNSITRAQLTKIIVLAQNWTVTQPGQPTFSDVPASDPFYGYVETAYAHSVISGYSCGGSCLEFRPGNNATRGQISKIVYEAVTSR